ncbi:hypothetical protein RPMA_05065 [Tardiphaga alba]|uniref:Uncharacterized protein n=1 Tax=Tardiphaga alba TaxID=340268 RepID=A0ABX8A4H0_9BRAD|nr:hypothetical protein [Tardiphaga alba]QUS38282.1 hypothetical protein RPMA_05065 [Tardiphaga alba]
MSITASSRVSPTTSHPMRRAGDIVIERDAPQTSQALTPTEPVARTIPASLRSVRPDASFIAHLIATAEQVPQTRNLRRAEIVDVEAAYRKAAGVYAAGAATNRMTRVA